MAENFSLLQELIRGGITMASVFIGGLMALRTYRSNQWWNVRHKAYEQAIELADQLDSLSMKLFLLAIKIKDPNNTDLVMVRNECACLNEKIMSFTSRSRFNISDYVSDQLWEVNEHVDDLMKRTTAPMSKDDDWDMMRIFELIEKLCHTAKEDLQVLPWHLKYAPIGRKFWYEKVIPNRNAALQKAHLLALIVCFGEAEGVRRAKSRLQADTDSTSPLSSALSDDSGGGADA